MVSITDLRKQLSEEGLSPFCTESIAHGVLLDDGGTRHEYHIFTGWDLVRANQCDIEWNLYNVELLEYISQQQYSATELEEINKYIQLDDSHWEWLTKSCVWKTNEYKWFFLYIDDSPQSACVIYHPKTSAIEHSKNIYYIEFLAAAPWNRRNPMSPQRFKSVGKTTLKHVQEYCSNELNWNLGFSLHSLPKAESYYQHIGMTPFSALDKKVSDVTTLRYFEMLEEPAKLFVRGS
ncbi:N-acetyltransferase [Vibrio europaeus]|uniref:N-acetyltransferase n=1 Tax=Vibrio europaeus TaxID=300876 RepID=UPI0018A76205|nr:N-acetyltransferase [Vibrio europaeus]MDC5809273.1 N-acetyltransferase [Vibrio europaeus]QPG36812.1 N-acetyltransferase [Vibrio europaeus]